MKTFFTVAVLSLFLTASLVHNHANQLIPKTIVKPNTTFPCMRGTTVCPFLSYARLSSGNRTGGPVRSLRRARGA